MDVEPSWEVLKVVFNKIPYKFLDKMVELTKESHLSNVEKGFAFCASKGGEYYVSETISGRGTELPITKRICGDDLPVGTFHTHPGGIADFSVGDLGTILKRNDTVACVSAIEMKEEVVENIKLAIPMVAVKCMTLNHFHPGYESVRERAIEMGEQYSSLLDRLIQLHEKKELTETEKKEFGQARKELKELRKKADALLEEMRRRGIAHFEDQGVVVEDGKVYVELAENAKLRFKR